MKTENFYTVATDKKFPIIKIKSIKNMSIKNKLFNAFNFSWYKWRFRPILSQKYAIIKNIKIYLSKLEQSNLV